MCINLELYLTYFRKLIMNGPSNETARFTNHILEEFEVNTLGLPFPVLVKNAVVERRDAETNEVIGHAIPDLDGLVAAVAMTRALLPLALRGKELRFMRKAIGMKSKDFAEAVGLTASSYSRYENDNDQMGGFVEQIVRELVCEELKGRAPAIDYSPRMIIGKTIVREWSEEPRFVLDRVVFKDIATQRRSEAWDTLPMAA
jgi:transcriptional regulator with XRE-family HTH domain